MSPSGIAKVTWEDAAQRVRGTAEVYCAALEEAGSRRPGYWPSRTYVCPECGQAWMQERWDHQFQYRSGAGSPWVVVTAPCRWHGGGFLLDNIPLEAASPEILRRELRLYFAHWDKEHHEHTIDPRDDSILTPRLQTAGA